MASPNKPSGTTHLNAKIDVDLKHKMKIYCAEQDINMQDFLADAIREALTHAKKKGKK